MKHEYVEVKIPKHFPLRDLRSELELKHGMDLSLHDSVSIWHTHENGLAYTVIRGPLKPCYDQSDMD